MEGITRRISNSLIAPLVASALGGCASDPGGQAGSDAIACILAGPFCAFMGTPQKAASTGTPAPTNSTSSWQPPSQFTSFGTAAPQSGTYAPSIGIDVGSQAAYWENTQYLFAYSSQYRNLGLVGPSGPAWPFDLTQPNAAVPAYLLGTTLSANGQPGIDVSKRFLASGYTQSGFTSLPVSGINVVANPFTLGWDYQSFGVWDQDNSHAVSAVSFGSLTPGSAIPATGTATFNGKLGGLYTSPAGVGSVASAELKVDADFSARSLSFASSGTTATRDFASASAMPGLNLSGKLAYSAATNSFSGTLTSASGLSGTSKGRFYGPSAQELGGVFAVRSATTPESFTGAYGAKR